MSRLNQLFKDSVIYGFGGAFVKSISFLMLPIYTRIFTPQEYGSIEMMVIIISFLIAILIMGMDSAQSYFFSEQKKFGKNKQAILVSAILQWRLISGFFIVLTATLISPYINKYFFNGDFEFIFFAIAFSQAFFSTIMSQSIEVLRLLFKPRSYIFINLLFTLLSAILILVLVISFDYSVLGYFLGTSIASFMTAIVGWFVIRDYINLKKIHYKLWPKLLKFGLPFLPTGIAFYFMSTMDRWFLQYYHGPEILGIYAIGAKFAMLIALIVETFRQAWWPIAMDSIHSNDGPKTLRMISRLYIGIGVSSIIILALISKELVIVFTTKAYYSSWPIVSILAWQSFFYGFYMIGSIGIWKSEKTIYTMFLMIAATIINLILNFLLVPKFAAIGASISTVISYLLWIVVSIIVSERLWRVRHQYYLIAFQVSAGMTIVFLIVFNILIMNILIYSILIAFSIILIFYAFQKDERLKIKNNLKYFFTSSNN